MKKPEFLPEKEISVIDKITGSEFYLVIDHLRYGICTGGLRISEDVTLDEVRRLAQTMSMKFSVFNLPVSGAKSGIRLTKGLTTVQRMEVVSRFAEAMSPYLTECYLTGDDLGCTQADIKKIYDTLNLHPLVASKHILAKTKMRSLILSTPDFVLTHFFPEFSKFGLNMTVKGLFHSLKNFLSSDNVLEAGHSISLQGVGSVGRGLLQLLAQLNVKIVKVSDKLGCVENFDGIPIKNLLKCIGSDGLIDRDKLSTSVSFSTSAKEMWCHGKIDILIPAATADVIDSSNIDLLECKYILQAANIVMDIELEEHLHRKGIVVLPDFLVNSAMSCGFGLMVSNQANAFSQRSIEVKTLDLMKNTQVELYEQSKKEGVSLRELFFSRLQHGH